LPFLSEEAYRAIKEKIITLELPPATAIDEVALMRELEIGRTPVREALRRLALEDLAVIVPHRGPFVSEIRVTDLPKIFEVRLVLESLSARLAARRATSEQLSQMQALFHSGSGRVKIESNNWALIALDRQFHHLLYKAADNEFLENALCRLYPLAQRLWYLVLDRIGDVGEIIEHHLALIAAIQAREDERAAQIMANHVRSFQVRFKNLL